MNNGEKKISNLFDGRTIFNIPEYQRAYAWGENQLSDFVEDLQNQKSERSYFFGTVLFEEKGLEKNYEIIDIVDGQQRLTTIIIFMAVLIESLKKKTTNEDELEDVDILYETYVKHKRKYKLRALEEDNDFFQCYILEKRNGRNFIRTPAQKRLYKAKKYFKEYLSAFNKDELNIIKKKIDENSRVLVYSVQDTAEAVLIFETTNDRGKGLTNLEKIKSFMMYKSYVASEEPPEQLLKIIRARFSDIYKEYEKFEEQIEENSILQYHFIGHEDWVGKEYQKYVSKVKDIVNDLISNEDDIKALSFIERYTKELKETFFTVHQILNSKNESLRNIFILSRTGNFWPLLIKTYKYDNNRNKPDFSRVARLMEIYSFRIYAVNQNRGNTGQSKFFKLAKNFSGNYSDLERSLKEIISEYSSDQIFKNYLSDSYIYEWMNPRDLSYFFWKYENHLRTSKQPKSSPMSEDEFISNSSKYKLTIEHIASQNPKKSIVIDEDIFPKLSEDFKENYLHSIGNLTIDPKSANSSKGNKEFKDKNKNYFTKAPFKTQNELEDFIVDKKWNKKSIEKREKILIDFALTYWNP